MLILVYRSEEAGRRWRQDSGLTLKERFAALVVHASGDACWTWAGQHHKGIPQFKVGPGEGGRWAASRVAFVIGGWAFAPRGTAYVVFGGLTPYLAALSGEYA
jgi:hypothetical protein